MTENEVAKEIVDAAYKIHQRLGPGLLESVYEVVLAYELQKRGLKVLRQHPISIAYEDFIIENAFRADLIVELKSVEQTQPVHKKQLFSYLVLTDKKLGLLINFGLELFKHGINRIVNGLEETPKPDLPGKINPHTKAYRT